MLKKKRYIFFYLIAIALLFIMTLLAWEKIVAYQLKKKLTLFSADHQIVKQSTYARRKRQQSLYQFHLNQQQPVLLEYWKMNLMGSIELVIYNQNQALSIQRPVSNQLSSELITLDPGHYQVKLNYNSFFGGCIIGVSTQLLSDLQPLTDSDNDGLPDALEKKYGTDPFLSDSDGDGLSDYHEIVKYRTDPLKRDSDQDGKIDSHWQERREFSYSIQVIVDLYLPFDIQQMNTVYQDARLIEQNPQQPARLEVIIYPQTELILNTPAYTPVDTLYTRPTFTKNYSPRMKAEIIDLTSGSQTTIQAVLKIIKKMRSIKSVDIVEDLKLLSDVPLDFYLIKDNEGQVMLSPRRIQAQVDPDKIMETVLFADSMYQNKTRGACGSTSILRGAMLRAAGIEERTIFTIPLFYTYDTDGTIIQIKEHYLNTRTLQLPSDRAPWIRNHVLNEIKLGSQWIQVDNGIGSNYTILNEFHIKLLHFHDISEIDFINNYVGLDFYRQRPCQYISIIEQEPLHGSYSNKRRN